MTPETYQSAIEGAENLARVAARYAVEQPNRADEWFEEQRRHLDRAEFYRERLDLFERHFGNQTHEAETA